MGLDELTIKKLRRRAGGLRHDFRISERKVAQTIANEYNLPSEMVRYHVSVKDKRYPGHYDLKYKKLIRHIDTFLLQVFKGQTDLQLKEISDRIENSTGISLKEKTLEKLIGKYGSSPKGSPLIKIQSGSYRLNDEYYKSKS